MSAAHPVRIKWHSMSRTPPAGMPVLICGSDMIMAALGRASLFTDIAVFNDDRDSFTSLVEKPVRGEALFWADPREIPIPVERVFRARPDLHAAHKIRRLNRERVEWIKWRVELWKIFNPDKCALSKRELYVLEQASVSKDIGADELAVIAELVKRVVDVAWITVDRQRPK